MINEVSGKHNIMDVGYSGFIADNNSISGGICDICDMFRTLLFDIGNSQYKNKRHPKSFRSYKSEFLSGGELQLHVSSFILQYK